MGFWNQFEGQLLDGQFKLAKYSGADGPCAIFLSELPDQEKFVAVKLIRSASIPARALSTSWKIAKDLQHPNLIRVYATGTADLDGLRVVYAVLDCPDASLADVIQERCLNGEEARDVLVSCTEGLHYLHHRGLVHTRMRPATIFAVDDATKLSTDYLCRPAQQSAGPAEPDSYDAPELKKTGYSMAGDIWALGATLFEALTQSAPAGNADSQLSSLPHPFSDILRHCLNPRPLSRWSARQILAHVQRGASTPDSVAADPNPLPLTVPVAYVNASPARPRAPRKSRAPAIPPDPASKPNLFERWILLIRNFVPVRYAVSAALIILCLGWLARTSQTDRPGSGTAGAAGFAVPGPQAPVSASSTENAHPNARSFSSRLAETRSGTAERARSVWRVVVYTYSSAQSAQSKVQDINAKSPKLAARVLSSAGERSNLVVVGGAMTRAAATDLRTRLLDQGFPKDIYIQNFPE